MMKFLRIIYIFFKSFTEFIVYNSTFAPNKNIHLFRIYRKKIFKQIHRKEYHQYSMKENNNIFLKNKLYEQEFVSFHMKRFFVVCYPIKKIIVPRVFHYYLILFYINFFLKKDFFFILHYGDKTNLILKNFNFMTFCKSKFIEGQFLVPDHEMLWQSELLNRRMNKASFRITLKEKNDKAYWRGATTGGDFSKKNWQNIPRAKLVKISNQNPNLIDAKFSSLCQGAEINKNGFDESYVSKRESETKGLDYKLVIDIDGNTLSWSRIRWLFKSRSLVLKQLSTDEQWYSSFLNKNTHFLGGT